MRSRAVVRPAARSPGSSSRRAASAPLLGAPGRPRIHGLRHFFAVKTLAGWYRDGHDVQARLPRLATFLGHRNPASTYWYLSAAPELLSLAAARLEMAQGTRS